MSRCVRVDPPARVQAIIDEVAAEYDLAPWQIMSMSRARTFTRARWVAMWRVRQLRMPDGRQHSTVLVGQWFGRDHSTVVHGLAEVERLGLVPVGRLAA
jgi:chromosomal replication initiator protein